MLDLLPTTSSKRKDNRREQDEGKRGRRFLFTRNSYLRTVFHITYNGNALPSIFIALGVNHKHDQEEGAGYCGFKVTWRCEDFSLV